MTMSLRERLAARLYESHHRRSYWGGATAMSRDVWLENADAAISVFEADLSERKLRIVPEEITEDMAAEMECQFSTEDQWDAALQAAASAAALRRGEK